MWGHPEGTSVFKRLLGGALAAAVEKVLGCGP